MKGLNDWVVNSSSETQNRPSIATARGAVIRLGQSQLWGAAQVTIAATPSQPSSHGWWVIPESRRSPGPGEPAPTSDARKLPAAVIEAILKGPMSDRLFGLVQKQVQRTLDEQSGLAKPLVVFAVGSTKYQEMKRSVSEKVMQHLPETLSHMEAYAEEAMDLKNLMVEKMQELTEEEFEGLLRPAFQQDEWILITVGALLGFLVGELQVHVMIHFAVPVV